MLTLNCPSLCFALSCFVVTLICLHFKWMQLYLCLREVRFWGEFDWNRFLICPAVYNPYISGYIRLLLSLHITSSPGSRDGVPAGGSVGRGVSFQLVLIQGAFHYFSFKCVSGDLWRLIARELSVHTRCPPSQPSHFRSVSLWGCVELCR